MDVWHTAQACAWEEFLGLIRCASGVRRYLCGCQMGVQRTAGFAWESVCSSMSIAAREVLAGCCMLMLQQAVRRDSQWRWAAGRATAGLVYTMPVGQCH